MSTLTRSSKLMHYINYREQGVGNDAVGVTEQCRPCIAAAY